MIIKAYKNSFIIQKAFFLMCVIKTTFMFIVYNALFLLILVTVIKQRFLFKTFSFL